LAAAAPKAKLQAAAEEDAATAATEAAADARWAKLQAAACEPGAAQWAAAAVGALGRDGSGKLGAREFAAALSRLPGMSGDAEAAAAVPDAAVVAALLARAAGDGDGHVRSLEFVRAPRERDRSGATSPACKRPAPRADSPAARAAHRPSSSSSSSSSQARAAAASGTATAHTPTRAAAAAAASSSPHAAAAPGTPSLEAWRATAQGKVRSDDRKQRPLSLLFAAVPLDWRP
jgi:hypothetical protein